MTVRIIIADDHQLLRSGLTALLRDVPDVEVVAEAGDGASAIALCEELKPDLLIMDLVMPVMSGLEALTHLSEHQPEVRVLVLSMHVGEEHVLRALKLGAAGYLVKDAAPEELLLAIRAVMIGKNWLSSAVSKHVIDGYIARNSSEGPQDLISQLTQRQHQVLKLIAEGVTTRDISAQLGLSVKTVETYRQQIMERLNIHDIASLTRFAVRHGIVPL